MEKKDKLFPLIPAIALALPIGAIFNTNLQAKKQRKIALCDRLRNDTGTLATTKGKPALTAASKYQQLGLRTKNALPVTASPTVTFLLAAIATYSRLSVRTTARLLPPQPSTSWHIRFGCF